MAPFSASTASPPIEMQTRWTTMDAEEVKQIMSDMFKSWYSGDQTVTVLHESVFDQADTRPGPYRDSIMLPVVSDTDPTAHVNEVRSGRLHPAISFRKNFDLKAKYNKDLPLSDIKVQSCITILNPDSVHWKAVLTEAQKQQGSNVSIRRVGSVGPESWSKIDFDNWPQEVCGDDLSKRIVAVPLSMHESRPKSWEFRSRLDVTNSIVVQVGEASFNWTEEDPVAIFTVEFHHDVADGDV